MNCKNCGRELLENSKFCTFCGVDQGEDLKVEQSNGNSLLVGYSEKITDPSIALALKKMNKSGVVFTLVLAVVAVFGFSMAGALEVGGFELPYAFYFGLALGGLLIALSFFQGAKGKKDGTWDGVVIDKTYKKASYAQRETGDHRTRYTIKVRKNDGSIKKLSCTEDLYHYYKIGDHVRHHGGTLPHLLEKYDKSNDRFIYCIVCSTKNEIENNICRRCKSPLMK